MRCTAVSQHMYIDVSYNAILIPTETILYAELGIVAKNKTSRMSFKNIDQKSRRINLNPDNLREIILLWRGRG